MDQEAVDHTSAPSRAAVLRKSDRELVLTRLFDAPPPSVFRAWAEPELFRRWWVPAGAGLTLLSCQMDVRTGGEYRMEFSVEGGGAMAFYGRYLDVTPNARIVWTNEEEENGAVTTVTFGEQGGKTLLTFHELYASEEARDEAMSGSAQALPAQLDQLDELLPSICG